MRETPPANEGPMATAKESVRLEVVGPKELDAAIASYRGRVVLVDFWATWCHSCVKLLPHVVELDKKHSDRGLVIIGVSLNDLDDAQAVRTFLEKESIPFRSFISDAPNAQESHKAFRLDSLPTYRLYDRTGKLTETFNGSFETADLDRAIEERFAEREFASPASASQ